jgi:hypothetical protein
VVPRGELYEPRKFHLPRGDKTEVLKGQDHGSMVKHTSSIKEKAMTLKSRLFQANFSTAALAIALLVQASPACAEVVTLVCQNESGSSNWRSSFTLRVNYDRKIVDLLQSDGGVLLSSAATITESDVKWFWDNSKWDYNSDKAQGFMGALNRLSGEAEVTFSVRQVIPYHLSGPCRRATQKF